MYYPIQIIGKKARFRISGNQKLLFMSRFPHRTKTSFYLDLCIIRVTSLELVGVAEFSGE